MVYLLAGVEGLLEQTLALVSVGLGAGAQQLLVDFGAQRVLSAVQRRAHLAQLAADGVRAASAISRENNVVMATLGCGWHGKGRRRYLAASSR